MAVAEVRGLSKHFEGGRIKAVDEVDLRAEEGEFLVLLGPSGCGKTTLLRTIAGLEEPTHGEVLIGGQVVTGLPPRAREVAMVFQNYALYPQKTVLGNITFPLKAVGLDRGQREERARWAAELVGIDHLLERRPRHLSGGERQRVALARALVREPSVFLLDEPLSNLDAKLRATARDDLKEFQGQIGTTTIYVTHDQIEAMGMGDRIAVMDAGRVRQLGPPREVYADPADTFVATFLGSPPMNLVERDEVLVGFRPEHLLPFEVVEDPDRCVSLSLDVSRVEYLSGDRHLHGTVTGLGEPARVVARLPSTVTATIESGHRHRFAVHERYLRFFDRESGERTEPASLRS